MGHHHSDPPEPPTRPGEATPRAGQPSGDTEVGPSVDVPDDGPDDYEPL